MPVGPGIGAAAGHTGTQHRGTRNETAGHHTDTGVSMSVGTRTETGRPARRATETGRPARRVHDAERVKSGAAQRAYERRRQRSGTPAAPAGTELTGRVPFVAAILAMFGCGLALTLVLTTRAAEDSYQLSDAREANRVLADERAALQREVAAADSAPELATRARELGMIPADDPARLVVAPDGTITVIGEPAPAQGPPAPPLNPPPRTVPRNGADPGERVVPVPSTPPAAPGAATPPSQTGDTAPARPGELTSGAVLAAPGGDPAQPQPGPGVTPAPGEPGPGQAPAGAVPGPEAEAAQGVPVPPDAGAAPAAPAAGAPAPGSPEAGVPAPEAPGAAAAPPPGQAAGNETTTPAAPPPPGGAPVADPAPLSDGSPAAPVPGAAEGEGMR